MSGPRAVYNISSFDTCEPNVWDWFPGDPPVVCTTHGSRWNIDEKKCATDLVLAEVNDERERQFARYGDNADLLDGTGPDARWAAPLAAIGAQHVERIFRSNYERFEADAGKPTWMHLLREEVSEAFTESDPQRLREELIQVAAVAVSWIEKLDAREEQG